MGIFRICQRCTIVPKIVQIGADILKTWISKCSSLAWFCKWKTELILLLDGTNGVINLFNIELTDVFRTKQYWSVPFGYLLKFPLPSYPPPFHGFKFDHCTSDLNSCFCCNGLSLNAVNSEPILLGTHQHLCLFPSVPGVNNASSQITVSNEFTTLHVVTEIFNTWSPLTLQFARNLFHLQALRHICSFHKEDMAGSM